MALLADYEVGGEIHQDAYVRVEHIGGSKAGGWDGVVYVFDASKSVILDTFNVHVDFSDTARGYANVYAYLSSILVNARSV